MYQDQDEEASAEPFHGWLETHQDQKQDNKNIIIVCKDERDWINPETGKPYSDFFMCDLNMMTSKNMQMFRDSVIVLNDMSDKLNKDIAYYFTEGRHHNFQMVVMCHKPNQIFKTTRMSSDTIFLRNYNGADLFEVLNEIYKFEHKFYEIINELNSSY